MACTAVLSGIYIDCDAIQLHALYLTQSSFPRLSIVALSPTPFQQGAKFRENSLQH